MAHTGKNCQFRLPFFTQERYQCPHPIEANTKGEPFCLFHITKVSEEEKRGMTDDELQKVNMMEFVFSNRLLGFIKRPHTSSEKYIDCRGFRFPDTNIKEDVTFHKDVNFTGAVFESLSFFASTMSLGNSEISAKGIHFHEHADFTETVFKGFAGFILVTFHRGATFFQAKFEERAIFERTVFGGITSFDEAIFNDESDFTNARFAQPATFRETTFEQSANFLSSNFENGADFSSSAMGPGSDFTLARLAKGTDFSRVRFGEGAQFKSTIIPDRISFAEATLGHKFRFSPFCLADADFTSLDLPKDSDVTFEKVDLKRASFLDTNLELIAFRDVEWARPTSRFATWFRGSRCLWDEFRPATEANPSLVALKDYEKIAENYRQLVINYERKRDYDSAEDFHVGEMEMRRQKKGNRAKYRYNATKLDRLKNWTRIFREWINSYNLYRILSNYGTSYWQALLVLVVLILIFSFAFVLAGFQPSKDSSGAPTKLIEYDLLSDSNHHSVSVRQLVADYREAVLFTFSIITFQKERFYEPVGWQARLCLYLAVLFLTAQGALVLLALRRRFKR
jgi:uncharacterized protein YjbI with pentapeptide repeats